MATIGRQRALCEIGPFVLGGRIAWWLWLLVHSMGLTGFRSRGARLIVAGKGA